MQPYKIEFIKELIIPETNQKVIHVGIVPPYEKKKPENVKLHFAHILAWAKVIFLKVASDSEYAKNLLNHYVNDETFIFDFTLFFGVTESNKIVFYHENVIKTHLNQKNEPFFEISFNKNNGQIILDWGQEISNAGIDIALRDILVFLKYKSSYIENPNANESLNGILKISVSHNNRELHIVEKELMDNRIIPRNHVILESKGFSFDEIKQVLQTFKTSLPISVTSRLLYEIDFLKLTLK
jgi:hypothetical protein